MATRTRGANESKSVNAYGLTIIVFENGAFYQGVFPGGFGDPQTGYHIPGPKALLDDSTNKRDVTGYIDLPEPVQLPHVKIVVEVSEAGKSRVEKEVPFNSNDAQPVYEVFQMALSTGAIRIVPEAEMISDYPETWEKRQDKVVWRAENASKALSASDLIQEARENKKFARLTEHAKTVTAVEQKKREEIAQDTTVKPPPPPPPPPKN